LRCIIHETHWVYPLSASVHWKSTSELLVRNVGQMASWPLWWMVFAVVSNGVWVVQLNECCRAVFS
jgi:hypothetical protein